MNRAREVFVGKNSPVEKDGLIFEFFIHSLIPRDIPYKTGVLDTDSGQNGSLLVMAKIITNITTTSIDVRPPNIVGKWAVSNALTISACLQVELHFHQV